MGSLGEQLEALGNEATPQLQGLSGVLLQGQARWLNSKEICRLLEAVDDGVFYCLGAWLEMPQAGRIYVFDRNMNRHFRKDNVQWQLRPVSRRSNKTPSVKEFHESFGVPGLPNITLSVYYATSADSSLQRRLYWRTFAAEPEGVDDAQRGDIEGGAGPSRAAATSRTSGRLSAAGPSSRAASSSRAGAEAGEEEREEEEQEDEERDADETSSRARVGRDRLVLMHYLDAKLGELSIQRQTSRANWKGAKRTPASAAAAAAAAAATAAAAAAAAATAAAAAAQPTAGVQQATISPSPGNLAQALRRRASRERGGGGPSSQPLPLAHTHADTPPTSRDGHQKVGSAPASASSLPSIQMSALTLGGGSGEQELRRQSSWQLAGMNGSSGMLGQVVEEPRASVGDGMELSMGLQGRQQVTGTSIISPGARGRAVSPGQQVLGDAGRAQKRMAVPGPLGHRVPSDVGVGGAVMSGSSGLGSYGMPRPQSWGFLQYLEQQQQQQQQAYVPRAQDRWAGPGQMAESGPLLRVGPGEPEVHSWPLASGLQPGMAGAQPQHASGPATWNPGALGAASLEGTRSARATGVSNLLRAMRTDVGLVGLGAGFIGPWGHPDPHMTRAQAAPSQTAAAMLAHLASVSQPSMGMGGGGSSMAPASLSSNPPVTARVIMSGSGREQGQGMLAQAALFPSMQQARTSTAAAATTPSTMLSGQPPGQQHVHTSSYGAAPHDSSGVITGHGSGSGSVFPTTPAGVGGTSGMQHIMRSPGRDFDPFERLPAGPHSVAQPADRLPATSWVPQIGLGPGGRGATTGGQSGGGWMLREPVPLDDSNPFGSPQAAATQQQTLSSFMTRGSWGGADNMLLELFGDALAPSEPGTAESSGIHMPIEGPSHPQFPGGSSSSLDMRMLAMRGAVSAQEVEAYRLSVAQGSQLLGPAGGPAVPAAGNTISTPMWQTPFGGLRPSTHPHQRPSFEQLMRLSSIGGSVLGSPSAQQLQGLEFGSGQLGQLPTSSGQMFGQMGSGQLGQMGSVQLGQMQAGGLISGQQPTGSGGGGSSGGGGAGPSPSLLQSSSPKHPRQQ